MPDIIYPSRYNKNTHTITNKCKAYSKLPVTHLDLQQIAQLPNLFTIDLFTGDLVEVTKTFIGYKTRYYEIIFNSKTYYIDKDNLFLTLEDRVEIVPSEKAVSVDIFVPKIGDFRNNWYKEKYGLVKYSEDLYYVPVVTQFTDTGNLQELQERAKNALIEGTAYILKYVGKNYNRKYIESILFGDENTKAFFEFSKVEQWMVEPRGADACSNLTFLITLRRSFAISDSVSNISTNDLANSRNLPLDEELKNDGISLNKLGAGNPDLAKKFIIIRINGFQEFRDHITKIVSTINSYETREKEFLSKFREEHIVLDNTNNILRVEYNLDLENESLKFRDTANVDGGSDFESTIINCLKLNNVDQKVYPDQLDINLNKLVIGFDDLYNIVYIECTRKGIPQPLLKFSSVLFEKDVGNAGLRSIRSGFLLYSITTDLEYLKDRSVGDQLNLLSTTYPYEQWLNLHIKPPPNPLDYPKRDLNCVKDSIGKIKQTVGLGFRDYDRIKNIKNQFVKENARREGYFTGFGDNWEGGGADQFIPLLNKLKNSYRDANVKRLLVEILVCISKTIDSSSFLGFAQKFQQQIKILQDKLIKAFCNPEFIKALDVVSFFNIPEITVNDANQQLVDAIQEAFIELIIKIFVATIKFFTILLEESCNPNSPFSAANDLGLDAAIDAALANASGQDNPAAGNMLDTLGYPRNENIDGSSSGGSSPNAGSAGDNPNTTERLSPEDKAKIKSFINDVACILSTSEFCSLVIGNGLSLQIENLIQNIINVKYPEYKAILSDSATINDLFKEIGSALGILEICKAIDAVPESQGTFCAESPLSNKDKATLAIRNIPEDLLNKLLDDLKKKREANFEGLLDAISPNLGNPTPLLCNPATGEPGLVNAAKADPEYARMFENNLRGTIGRIIPTLNKDLSKWKDKIQIKETASQKALDEASAAITSIISDQTKSTEQKSDEMKATLIAKGLIKEDADGKFIPGDALLPPSTDQSATAETDNSIKVTLKVAPNVSDNLSSSKLFFANNKEIRFTTNSESYRNQYISIALSNLAFSSNIEYINAVRKAQRELSRIFIEEVVVVIDRARSDAPSNIFGVTDTFGKVQGSVEALDLVDFLAYAFALFEIFVNAVAESSTGSRPQQTFTNLAPPLPNKQNVAVTNEKSKVVPPVPDKPVPPKVEQTITTGQPRKLPSYWPPMKPDEALKSYGVFLQAENATIERIKSSTILGPTIDLITKAGKVFENLLKETDAITNKFNTGIEQVSAIHAAFPDYSISYKYGLTSGSVSIVSSEGRIINNYTLEISQSVMKEGSQNKTETEFKPYIGNKNFELVDKDISDYIISNGFHEGFTPSRNTSLQEYVFNNYRRKKLLENPKLNPDEFTYAKILNNFINTIRQNTSNSVFFKSQDAKKATPSLGNTNSIPALPYLNYLDLIESTTSYDDFLCGKDKNLVDTDSIADNVMDRFINDDCNFEAPGDPNVKRNRMNPVERHTSNGIIQFTIRVYLIDYYLKGLFTLDTIRPGFIYDQVVAETFAAMMESEMKTLSSQYFERFLDAVQQYHMENSLSDAIDIAKISTSDIKIKRAKFVQVILKEMLEMSKILGTKVNEVDGAARLEQGNTRSNDINTLFNPNRYVVEPVDYEDVEDVKTTKTIALGGNRREIARVSFNTLVETIGQGSLTIQDDFELKTFEETTQQLTDKHKNASSPYGLLSLTEIAYPFRLDGNSFERHSIYIASLKLNNYNNLKKPEFETIAKSIPPNLINGQKLFFDDQADMNVALINDVKFGQDVEYRFLMEFCFPLRKLYGLFLNYCVLGNNTRPEMKNAFKSTKAELANAHESFMNPRTRNQMRAIPPSIANDPALLMSSGQYLSMATQDLIDFIIESFIETPLSIIKGTVEGGGDLNGFIASIPYRITKPLWMAFNEGEIPFQTGVGGGPPFPLFTVTPLIGFVLGIFLPPSLSGAAYYLTLRWWDKDYFKKRSAKDRALDASKELFSNITSANNAEEGVPDDQCIQDSPEDIKTAPQIKYETIKKLSLSREHE